MDASQNRQEFKFVLPPELGERVRRRVAGTMKADRGAADGYPVLSEYFDCGERASYWQKQFGASNRRRLRSRVYGRSDGAIPASAFIEVKHKLDGVTTKRRVPVSLADLERLANGVIPERGKNTSPVDARVIAEISDLVLERGCRPVVQIRYHRFAYDSGPDGTLRVTFDQDPRCRFRRVPLMPDDPDFELPLLESGSSIMEVKTIGPVPYWFRDLIGEFQLIPRSFSKYSAALELYEFKRRPHGLESIRQVRPATEALIPVAAGGEIRRSPVIVAAPCLLRSTGRAGELLRAVGSWLMACRHAQKAR